MENQKDMQLKVIKNLVSTAQMGKENCEGDTDGAKMDASQPIGSGTGLFLGPSQGRSARADPR